MPNASIYNPAKTATAAENVVSGFWMVSFRICFSIAPEDKSNGGGDDCICFSELTAAEFLICFKPCASISDKLKLETLRTIFAQKELSNGLKNDQRIKCAVV